MAQKSRMALLSLLLSGAMCCGAMAQSVPAQAQPAAQARPAAQAGQAQAQPVAQTPSAKKSSGAKFGLSNPNAPISVAADRLDADQNSHTLIYSGHAVVRQGDVFLHTDRLRVVAPDGKTPDKIYAEGNVVLTASSGTATGDHGIYDVNPRIITLKGHVVLTRGENVMRGAALTINLISGVAHLSGAPAAAARPGRIQGMFTPRDLSNDAAGGTPKAKQGAGASASGTNH